MMIKRIDGTAIVELTAEDCALLAQACDEIRLSDALCSRGAEIKQAAYEALGAAFSALGMACLIRLSVSPQVTSTLHAYLVEVGLGDLVEE